MTWVGSNASDGIFRKDEREDTETEGEAIEDQGGHQGDAPTGQETPSTTRSKEGFSPEVFGGAWSCQHFEVELVAPELRR